MYTSVRSSAAARLSSLVRSTRGEQISVRFLPGGRLMYSVVVPKRQGNAVKRNRAKRIIREIMRLNAEKVPQGTYLIYVNQPCATLRTSDLEPELLSLIDRARSRQAGTSNETRSRNNK